MTTTTEAPLPVTRKAGETTLTIDQLCMSPFNVRTAVPHPERDAEMEASILVKGQENPIIVHAMKGSKTKFGALGGGRRYRAFKALIARGDMPMDQPIRVTERFGDTAELLEISVTENLIRLDLLEHELFAAIARIAANGHDVDQIAANLGRKDPALVRRWLRLGQLAKPVFAAYAAGRLDLARATAYAATEDQALQASVYARLSAGPDHAHTPAAIRLAMNVGDREMTRLLRYVGLDTYREAGGRFELDLFADETEQRGRVVDDDRLHKLVDAKLATKRDEVRTSTGRPALRFIPKPPQTTYDTDDYQLQVEPKRNGAGPGSLELPDGDIVGHIAIDAAGQSLVSFWWPSRKAKFGRPRAVEDPPVSAGPIAKVAPGAAVGSAAVATAKASADAAIKEEAGLGQDAIQILRSMRRVILRALLVRDAQAHGDVASDYLVWAQLRMLIGAQSSSVIGIHRLPTDTIGGTDLAQRATAQIEASGAAGPVGAAMLELSRQTFATERDLERAFLDYRASDRRLKNLSAAVVAGVALERSLASGGYEIPIHDALARMAGGDAGDVVREHWQPTTELLGLHPREQRLALAADLVDAATIRRWSALRNDQVTDVVLEAVTADPAWVHPLLRFAGPADDAAALREDAA